MATPILSARAPSSPASVFFWLSLRGQATIEILPFQDGFGKRPSARSAGEGPMPLGSHVKIDYQVPLPTIWIQLIRTSGVPKSATT